ncbi:hypothetical protein [Limosilactobacillus sp.]|uniref:hypothetical protein n=1 Tax=Limosilactobacillus sp. TaxID=2773925 RepID=UPI003F0E7BC6
MVEAISSGLIAGLVAAMVNILVTRWNNKTQKETKKMEISEKQKEIALDWTSELMKYVSEFLECCFKLNIANTENKKLHSEMQGLNGELKDKLQTDISEIDTSELSKMQQTVNDAKQRLNKQTEKLENSFTKLNQLQVLIRLCLYEDNIYSADILECLRTILKEGEDMNRVSPESEDALVEATKEYIRHSWEKQ